MGNENYIGEYFRIRKLMFTAYGGYFKEYLACWDRTCPNYGNQKTFERSLDLLRSELNAFYHVDYYKLEEGFVRAKKRMEAKALREKCEMENRLKALMEDKVKRQQMLANKYHDLIVEIHKTIQEAMECGLDLEYSDDDPL